MNVPRGPVAVLTNVQTPSDPSPVPAETATHCQTIREHVKVSNLCLSVADPGFPGGANSRRDAPTYY